MLKKILFSFTILILLLNFTTAQLELFGNNEIDTIINLENPTAATSSCSCSMNYANLVLNNQSSDMTGNYNTTGNFSASYFIGDGSKLWNLPGSSGMNYNNVALTNKTNTFSFDQIFQQVNGTQFNLISDGDQIIMFGTSNWIKQDFISNVFEITNTFKPSVNNTYDLGNDTRRWRTVFGNVFVGSGANLTGISIVNNSYYLKSNPANYTNETNYFNYTAVCISDINNRFWNKTQSLNITEINTNLSLRYLTTNPSNFFNASNRIVAVTNNTNTFNMEQTFNGNISVGGGLVTGIVKINAFGGALPTCNSAYNNSIVINSTGVWACGGVAPWKRMVALP